jgi:hypothetical protein
MSESQENIEARLIAYLEGQMDLGDRAEIERHLAANPTHRKLLDELRRTREFVVALPKAKAPSELVDVLQGQLERSALLDDMSADEAGTLRIGRGSRWPQIISVAAVVLLAVGLGAIVYVALPHESSRPTLARGHGDEATATSAPLVAPLAGTRATTTVSTITVTDPTRAKELATFAPPGPATKPATPAVADALAGENNTLAAGVAGATAGPGAMPTTSPTELPVAMVQPTPADHPGPPITGGFAASSPVGPAPLATPLIVVVSANDIRATNTEVATYLAANNIPYENVAPVVGQVPAMSMESAGEESKSLADFPLGTKAATDSVATTPAQQPLQQELRQQYNAGVGDEVAGDKAGKQVARLQQAQGPALAGVGAPHVDDDNVVEIPRIANQFLARRMSRQQVSELQAALGQPANVKVIETSAPAQRQVASATKPDAPADVPLRAGDRVEVTVDQLVGPGVERTNRLDVASDGTITMPMLPETVRAEGLTTRELADTVARRYRDASLIVNPTVRARPIPDALATTQPAATAPSNMTGAMTGPSVSAMAATVPVAGAAQPTTTAASATQPLGPVVADRTTVDADDDNQPVDVMIVVQAVDPDLLPTTTPATTAPATTPATTDPSPANNATTSPVAAPTTSATIAPVVTVPVTQPTSAPAP